MTSQKKKDIALCAKHLKVAFGLFIFLFFSVKAFALDSNKAVSQYVQHHWSNQDGLPQNTVTSISQTTDGYLWLGTLEGLVRFDGVRYTTFNTRNTSALKHNMIVDLLTDSKGTLWIATSGGGVVSLIDGVFKRYDSNDGLPVDQVSAIFEDRFGNIIIGTDGGGLSNLQAERFNAPSSFKELGLSIRAVTENDQGLWIASEKGLFQITNKKEIVKIGASQHFSDNLIRSLFFDKDNSLWVGTDSGLIRRQYGHFVQIDIGEISEKYQVLDIHQDGQNNLWVATDNAGLLRLVESSNKNYEIQVLMADRSVWSIYEDTHQNLWAGSQFGGLTRIKDTPITSFTTAEGLSINSIRSVLQTTSGNLLVGTEGGGVNQLVDGKFHPMSDVAELSNRKIYSMLEDSIGALWFGTDEGLVKVYNQKATVYTMADGLLADTILSLAEDHLGNLWIGSYSGGLNRFKDGIFESFTQQQGLPNNTVNIIMLDSKNVLWVGTRGGGLASFSHGKFNVLSTQNGLSDDLVFALSEDSSGSLWIGTYGGGINRLRDGSISIITEKQGLFDDVIHRIIPDGHGLFWMSSNKGIFSVSEADLNRVADGNSWTLESKAYGVSDGMKNSECNGGANAGIATRQGQIWFPTVEGVVRFDPTQIKNPKMFYQPMVEEILLEKNILRKNELDSLGPDIRNMEIHYTTSNLTTPEKMEFRYRLEGIENDWIYAGVRRVAYFNNLPAGQYQFRVMATLKDTPWIGEGASLLFTVVPKFYQTSWFRSVILVVFFILVYFSHRFRVTQLQKRNFKLEETIKARTGELQQANLRLERLATEDGLTGVLNRRAFNEILAQECRRVERNQSSISLMIIDIDFFKQYNDSLGHPEGDVCICKIADILSKTCCRAGEIVARYGGDEFVVVLPGIDQKKAVIQANKICQSVQELSLLHPQSEVSKYVSVTIGVGSYCLPKNCSPKDILELADRGLYIGKRGGRNQVGCEAEV